MCVKIDEKQRRIYLTTLECGEITVIIVRDTQRISESENHERFFKHDDIV